MPLRLCSILGTLVLALSVTSPAFAKKKKGDDSSEKATSSSSSAKKSKKGKKGDDKARRDTAAHGGRTRPRRPTMSAASAEPQESPPNRARGSARRRKKRSPRQPPPKPVEKPKGSDRPISAALFAGWAFKTDRQTNNIGTGADPYGLGGGLRGGYSFDFHLYVGVFFTYSSAAARPAARRR